MSVRSARWSASANHSGKEQTTQENNFRDMFDKSRLSCGADSVERACLALRQENDFVNDFGTYWALHAAIKIALGKQL